MNTVVEYKNTNICFTVIRKVLKDTVNDAASLNVSVLGKVELDELAKTTGVIVVHSLCVPKGLHDGTTNKRMPTKSLQRTFVDYCGLLLRRLTQNKIPY